MNVLESNNRRTWNSFAGGLDEPEAKTGFSWNSPPLKHTSM